MPASLTADHGFSASPADRYLFGAEAYVMRARSLRAVSEAPREESWS